MSLLDLQIHMMQILHLPISEDIGKFENTGKKEILAHTGCKHHFTERIIETDNGNHIGIVIERYTAIAVFC